MAIIWMNEKMMGTTCRIMIVISLVTLVVHLSMMMRHNESHSLRPIPRYVGDMELRNPNKYPNDQLEDIPQVALQSQQRFGGEAANIHFVARRDILDKNSKTQDLLEDYLNIEGEAGAFPFQCTSCSLVGNSGNLLYSKKGFNIDQSSCVFRLHLAPVKGFETDVGSKTTARITNSNRLYTFLKKPRKLITGSYGSDQWFLFDKHKGDITRLYGRLLPLTRKDKNIGFFWFTRKAELATHKALKKAGQKLKMKMEGVHPEALWYAIKVMEAAGCQSFEIFGIPDPRICKRNENLNIASKYWDRSSPNLCFRGSDAGFVPRSSKYSPGEVTSVSDRRGLLSWAMHRSNITFDVPPWPTSLFS